MTAEELLTELKPFANAKEMTAQKIKLTMA